MKRTLAICAITALAASACGGGGGSGLTCAAGTHELDGECVADVTCAAGTHAVDGECVADVTCAAGTHEEGGECVPDVTCGAGTHDEGGTCVPDDDPDTTAPVVTIAPVAGTYRPIPVVTITADEPATIYYTVDGTDPAPGTGTTVADGSPARILDIDADTTVRYLGVDMAGNESAIAEAVYTMDVTPPAAVTDLEAEGSTEGAPNVHLTWTNPAGADFARVVVARRQGAPVGDVLADGVTYAAGAVAGAASVVYVGTATNFLDTNVAGGVEYHYAAFAADALDNFAAPDEAWATTHYWHATVTIDAEDGSVVPIPATGAGELGMFGTATYDDVTDTLSLDVAIFNDSDRLLFNPKLVITGLTAGAAVGNESGEIEGDPFFYYGPRPVDAWAFSPEMTWTITGVTGTITFEVDLVTDAMLYYYGGGAGPHAVDTGTNLLVESMLPFNDTWYSEMTPDGRYILASRQFETGIEVFSTVRGDEAAVIYLAPSGDGLPGDVRQGGLVFSNDGSLVYAAGASRQSAGGWIMFLSEIEVGTWVELRRAELAGPIAASSSGGPTRNIAMDPEGEFMYLPVFQEGTIRVVDIAAMTEVDTDGVAANGVTSIELGELPDTTEVTYPTTVAIDPSATILYVGLGYAQARPEIGVIDLATMAVEEWLPSAITDGVGCGPNMMFGPDGLLYVPRTGYYSDPGDPDSWGISVYDVAPATPEETLVSVIGSYSTGTNDIWDLQFLPGTDIVYATMTDPAQIFALDYSTLTPVDVDGDSGNGHTNIETPDGSAYGGSLTLSPN